MKYVGENALKKWTSLVKSDIKKKLDKNQGTANSGKILGVDASGEVAPTDTEVATLVDVPNGIVKGDGSTLSAAVAGTDYMAPPTGGTTGQVLTKTTDGQEWQDREKAVFIVTLTVDDKTDKTVAEIKAASDAGKVCFLFGDGLLVPLLGVNDTMATFSRVIPMDNEMIHQYEITVQNGNSATFTVVRSQKLVEANGLLMSNGVKGNIYAATAGTDYVTPNGDGSNITAAFTAATTRANIATGEKLSVLFGKIAKWFADLGNLAFKSTVAKSDLASDVQTSLNKANSALQSVSKSDVGLGNVANERQYSSANPPPYPVTSVNGKTGAVTVPSVNVPATTSLLKGNGSGGLAAATRGSDYIASGNIVKQTLVASESTPTENYAINWVYG